MRESATLFIDSDRKLREKLSGDDDAELSDVANELGTCRKRKYNKQTDLDVDSLDESTELDRDETVNEDRRTERLVKQELVEHDGTVRKDGDNHL